MVQLPERPTLADLQTFVKKQCEARGWDDRTDIEKVMMLTEELGEVAKEVRKQSGRFGYAKPSSTEALAEEIADVLNWLLDLANGNDIDLEKAFRAKWKKTETRVWETDTNPNATK